MNGDTKIIREPKALKLSSKELVNTLARPVTWLAVTICFVPSIVRACLGLRRGQAYLDGRGIGCSRVRVKTVNVQGAIRHTYVCIASYHLNCSCYYFFWHPQGLSASNNFPWLLSLEVHWCPYVLALKR